MQPSPPGRADLGEAPAPATSLPSIAPTLKPGILAQRPRRGVAVSDHSHVGHGVRRAPTAAPGSVALAACSHCDTSRDAVGNQPLVLWVRVIIAVAALVLTARSVASALTASIGGVVTTRRCATST